MNIKFSKLIDGFILAANARRLSKNTIREYSNTYRKFAEFLVQDYAVGEINSNHIRKFLAAQSVTKKTLLNYHIGLSALWTWALDEDLVSEHIVRRVKRPKPEKNNAVSNAAARQTINAALYVTVK